MCKASDSAAELNNFCQYSTIFMSGSSESKLQPQIDEYDALLDGKTPADFQTELMLLKCREVSYNLLSCLCRCPSRLRGNSTTARRKSESSRVFQVKFVYRRCLWSGIVELQMDSEADCLMSWWLTVFLPQMLIPQITRRISELEFPSCTQSLPCRSPEFNPLPDRPTRRKSSKDKQFNPLPERTRGRKQRPAAAEVGQADATMPDSQNQVDLSHNLARLMAELNTCELFRKADRTIGIAL